MELGIFKKDVAVFAFFLFLSFVFWYLNSLGKEIEVDINYPVKYVNIPGNRIIVEEPSVSLDLLLKGPGYLILKNKLLHKKNPLIIDISNVKFKKVPESKPASYFFVTSGLTKSMTTQLRSGCEVVSIKPDTLFFTFEKKK